MRPAAARRGLRRTVLIAGAALLATIAVAILVGSRPTQPSSAIASPTAAPTPGPTATVDCREEPGDLALALTKPACPTAILAAEHAVAGVLMPIDRIVVDAGPFYCDVLWPGVQTVPVCRGGYSVSPGQFMHAWVSFQGSPKVAVVMMGLDLPEPVRDPGRTRPPWNTTLVTIEIPPTSWVMP